MYFLMALMVVLSCGMSYLIGYYQGKGMIVIQRKETEEEKRKRLELLDGVEQQMAEINKEYANLTSFGGDM